MDKADMAELGCKSKACVNALREREARKEFLRNAWSEIWLWSLRVPSGARVNRSEALVTGSLDLSFEITLRGKPPVGVGERLSCFDICQLLLSYPGCKPIRYAVVTRVDFRIPSFTIEGVCNREDVIVGASESEAERIVLELKSQ